MIKIVELRKSFEETLVLKDISLNIEKGKIYGLVGSNGCGKTTVFKHIMGIYSGDSGSLTYADQVIPNDVYLNNIYYVQDDLFFPLTYTLDDLFKYEKMLYKGMSQKKYNNLKEFFKMDGSKKLRSLSKGQKKQAAFILSVASMTETLLLDEIVDGLDAVIRKKFWKVLMSEVMDRGLTVIISSHALTELDNICDKVGILHDGMIVREDNMDTLKDETKRIQFAVKGDYEAVSSDAFEVIKTSLVGKVYFLVIKGDTNIFKTSLYEQNEVLLYDELHMNLEEIFVTELGGLGYGNEEYDNE